MQFFDPIFILSALIALTVHEWAHAFVAFKLGDPTAKYEGRLTLNPIAHLDPIGSVLILLIGFGWAKPVPVDPRYFKQPKRDIALVSVAGPFSNLILAFISFVLFAVITNSGDRSLFGLLTVEAGNPILDMLARLLASSTFINLALMAFNLLPFPPLDGSKILEPFVPLQYEMTYRRFLMQGQYLLLVVLVVDMVLNIPILSWWVFGIAGPVLTIFEAITGVFL